MAMGCPCLEAHHSGLTRRNVPRSHRLRYNYGRIRLTTVGRPRRLRVRLTQWGHSCSYCGFGAAASLTQSGQKNAMSASRPVDDCGRLQLWPRLTRMRTLRRRSRLRNRRCWRRRRATSPTWMRHEPEAVDDHLVFLLPAMPPGGTVPAARVVIVYDGVIRNPAGADHLPH